MAGRVILIEGLDLAGKSTLVRGLQKELTRRGPVLEDRATSDPTDPGIPMRAFRLLVATLVAGLVVGVGSAGAAIIGPSFSTSPFTIAQPGAGNTVTMNLIWEAAQFLPPTGTDKQTVTYQDLAGGSPQTFSASSTQTSIPLLLTNGHRYTITVSACPGWSRCFTM